MTQPNRARTQTGQSNIQARSRTRRDFTVNPYPTPEPQNQNAAEPESQDNMTPLRAEIAEHIAEHYRKNQEKNRLDREQKHEHKKAYEKMVQNGLVEVPVTLTDNEGNETTLDAQIASSESEYIDVRELYSLVDFDTFLSLVKATKTDVKEAAGSTVLHKVLRTKPGDEKLSVKKRK